MIFLDEYMVQIKEDLERISELPPGELLNEWIAFNIFEVYEYAQLFVKLIPQQCKCERMSMGTAEYLWVENNEQQSLPAAKYIENVMGFTKEQLNNAKVFPTEPGSPFSKNFPQAAA